MMRNKEPAFADAARVVELADTPDLGSGSARIGGSSPLARTTITEQIEGFSDSDTALTQEMVEIESANVKFPKRIKHLGRVCAMIYGKPPIHR
jgi:hypothetical protein